jgi:hypothetical protein
LRIIIQSLFILLLNEKELILSEEEVVLIENLPKIKMDEINNDSELNKNELAKNCH